MHFELETALKATLAVRMLYLKPIHTSSYDLALLQRLLEQAPRYAQIATLKPVSPSAAADILAALPPGKTYRDKFVLGVFNDYKLVGCIDLIRGYPSESVAYVGLLLIAEPYEGSGFGAQAFERVFDVVASWPTCTAIKIGVLANNEKAVRFWSKLGFAPTGESKPYQCGRVHTEVLMYQRPLAAA